MASYYGSIAREEPSGLPLEEARMLIDDAIHFRPHHYLTNKRSLRVYGFQDSNVWLTVYQISALVLFNIKFVRYAACMFYLFLGFHDMPWQLNHTDPVQAWNDLGCIVVFIIDLLMRAVFTGKLFPDHSSNHKEHIDHQTSPYHGSMKAVYALIFSIVCVVLDHLTRHVTLHQWSGITRPAILFYHSEAARISALNTLRTVSSVVSVIFLEWYIILVYACACYLLYGQTAVEDADAGYVFRSLGWSIINMFALSTTVNDPDVWLPLYALSPFNALLFISFLVVLLYFVHNLVIATVFDVYSTSLVADAKTREARRRTALSRAFYLLTQASEQEGVGEIGVEEGIALTAMKRTSGKAPTLKSSSSGGASLPSSATLALLSSLRPHYEDSKLEVLNKLIDPDNQGAVDEGKFSKGVVLALSKRVRSKDPKAPDWFCVNEKDLNEVCDGEVGMLWVLLALALLLIVDLLHEAKLTGVRHFFREGSHLLALASTAASAVAIYLAFRDGSLQDMANSQNPFRIRSRSLIIHLTLARCVDMVRLLGRIRASATVFATIGLVLPSIKGQAIVIFTTFHVFAWVGMCVWGGEITPSEHISAWTGSEPYYYLLNFNSYGESLVTLFALIVVNNWNLCADGYYELKTGGGPMAYVFFIVFNTVAVTMALNLMTAFYINAFQIATSLNEAKWKAQKAENESETVTTHSYHVSERFVDEAELLNAMLQNDEDNKEEKKKKTEPKINIRGVWDRHVVAPRLLDYDDDAQMIITFKGANEKWERLLQGNSLEGGVEWLNSIRSEMNDHVSSDNATRSVFSTWETEQEYGTDTYLFNEDHKIQRHHIAIISIRDILFRDVQ